MKCCHLCHYFIVPSLDISTKAPTFSITLPGGVKFDTDLKILNTKIKSLSTNKSQQSCNYIGNLKGDDRSIISATGCSELRNLRFINDTISGIVSRKHRKMHLTIFSSLTNTTKFVVHDTGKMYEVKSDGLRDVSFPEPSMARSARYRSLQQSNVLSDELVKDENFVKEMNISIAYGYDKSVEEYFVNEYSLDQAKAELNKWINDIHTHTQSSYWLSSLRTKINLKISII